jgi:group I intron endonuclease
MAAHEFSRLKAVCGIYRIFHVASGKSYIGSSVNIYRRWLAHLGQLRKGAHHSPKLQRAWLKYGQSAFQIEVVERVSDAADLPARETFHIVGHNAFKLGYNVAPVGGSTLGIKLGPHSDEHRQKIGAAHKGRIWSQHQRDQISKSLKGRVMSAEWCAKIAASMTGRKMAPLTPEHKAIVSAAQKGKTISAEHRQRLSEAHKGRKHSPEFVKKRADALRAYHQRRRTLVGATQLQLDLC